MVYSCRISMHIGYVRCSGDIFNSRLHTHDQLAGYIRKASNIDVRQMVFNIRGWRSR